MPHAIRFAIAICCVSFSLIASAEIFRWVDSDGSVHYSDQAPKSAHSESKITATPMVGDGTAPDYGIDLDKPKEKRKTPKQLTSLPKKDPGLCKRATTSLSAMQAGGRIRGKAADGSVTYLTPDEIAEQIELSKQTIAIHCG